MALEHRTVCLGLLLLMLAPAAATAEPAPPELLAMLSGDRPLDPAADAPALYAWVATASATDASYGPAMLRLAVALEKLGYGSASAAWLARIARERVDPVVVSEALELLGRHLEGPHRDQLAEAVLGPLEVSGLPDGVARRAWLVQGLIDLRAGRDEWARARFAKLPQGSPEAARATLAQLVTRVKRGAPAQQLLRPFAELAEDAQAPLEVRLEAQLAVARLRYESKDYPGALEAYRRATLPKLDPGRAALYLEEAWTSYRLGKTEDALALLVTLEAPAFEGAFLPDKFLLAAQLYLDRCHNLGARHAARALLRRFDGALEALQLRRELGEVDALRLAALATPQARRAQAYLERLERESSRLQREGEGEALGSELYAHLTDVYAGELAEAQRVRDQRLGGALEAVAERLLDTAEQARLVDYEVGMKLNAQLEASPLARESSSDPALGPLDVSYRFTGEYWNDELRDLRVSLDDLCQERAR